MFFARVLALLFLGLGSFSAAAKQMDLEGIPECAVSCMIRALPQTTCSPTDQACLCVDEEFNAAVAPCIQSTCTIKESLIVTNATWTQCEFPFTDKTPTIHWISGVITVIATVFILLRLASKAMKLSGWGADDTAIMVAYAMVLGFYIELFYFVRSGLGKDIWTLHDYEITQFLKLLFVLEFFYFIGLATIKASILFFFLKIFHPSRGFRRALWIMQVLNLLVGLAFILLCFAECQPLSNFWNGWDGEHEGKCLDLNRIGLSHVALNISLDIAMLILPLTQIYKLQMNTKKKLGVMAMFLVGIFLTIVSILRIKTLISFATSLNITADSTAVAMWAYVELGVGVVVACMPSVRQLLKRFFSHVAQVSSLITNRMSMMSTSRTAVGSQVYTDKMGKSFGETTTTTTTATCTTRTDSTAAPSVSSH